MTKPLSEEELALKMSAYNAEVVNTVVSLFQRPTIYTRSSNEDSAAREYNLITRYLKCLDEMRAIAAASELYAVEADLGRCIDILESDGPKELTWTEAIENRWGSGALLK